MWPDPLPFDDYALLPKFPTEMLPGICSEMTAAVSKTCQVDSGLTGSIVLAALSAAVGGKIEIDLGTHKEPGNLYILAVLGSGNRKSETFKRVMKPIYGFQHERQKALSRVISEAENKLKILNKRLAKMNKIAAETDESAERDTAIKDAGIALKEIDENPVPTRPVYICDDITPESLGQLMADNGGRMAVLSAEGGFFKIIAGFYSGGEANLDLILKAHAGDPWSNNRIGREEKTMECPSLTVGLAVQPNVLEEIGRNSEFRGRGLSARFLYAFCESKAGTRTRQSEPVPKEVECKYDELVTSLMKIKGRHQLSLTPEAQTLWDKFYNAIEKRLRPEGELENLIDWGSKLAGAAARIAGLLHLAEHGGSGLRQPIQKETVIKACGICGYYLEHAKAVFGLMGEDERISVGRKILEYIKRNNLKHFKGRDLIRHGSLKTMNALAPGLKILEERGYLNRANNTRGGGAGRPEADTYYVNPKIFG